MLTTRAAGFPRTNQPNVEVIAGQNTTVNLQLAPPPHLSYGQTIPGTIEAPTEVYGYTFTGQSGDNVVFRLAEVDSTLVPDVHIYRPDGSLLCNASSSSLAEKLCLLDAGGMHTILAGSFGSDTGAYVLSISEEP